MIPFLENKKVWSIPYLKIDEFGGCLEDLPNLHFTFFDRYEIHIQAFLYFINENLSVSDPHLRQI